jgi:uroporphyrinogen-III synthase
MKAALAGVRVAVTRPAGQAEELAQPLRAAGAEVLLAPLIRLVAAPLAGALLEAVQQVADYDWVVFSSVNGVELFLAAVRQAGNLADLEGTRIACVGPVTAAAAAAAGLRVEAVPQEFVGDAIANELAQRADVKGARVLLARAAGARAVLPQQLRARGALVDDVEVYRSVADEQGAQRLRAELQSERVDVLTFTSSSAVRYFAEHVGSYGKAIVAVIGPITAEAARAARLPVGLEAAPHTIEALVSGMVAYFAEDGSPQRNHEHK